MFLLSLLSIAFEGHKAEFLEVFEVQAVTTDHTEEMNKPTKRLTITGIVRRVTEEEEPYVQSLWYDRFWWDEDNDGEEEEDSLTGEDEATKETDKEKGTRTRWKVVNGAPASFKTGDGKPNPSNGMRRNSSKGVVEVDDQRPRNGGLRPSSTSDSTNSDTEIDNGQDITRREARASNIVRDLAGASSTDEATMIEGDLVGEIVEGEVGDLSEGVSVEGGDLVEGEWREEGTSWDVGTTFYKLEMLSMQLDLNSGLQVRTSPLAALAAFPRHSSTGPLQLHCSLAKSLKKFSMVEYLWLEIAACCQGYTDYVAGCKLELVFLWLDVQK